MTTDVYIDSFGAAGRTLPGAARFINDAVHELTALRPPPTAARSSSW